MTPTSTRFPSAPAPAPNPGPLPAAAPSEAFTNPLIYAVSTFLLLEIWLTHSRFFDLFLTFFRIPAMIFVMMTISILFTGRANAIIKSATGRWILITAFWFGVTIPFSQWRSQSASLYVGSMLAIPTVIAIVAFSVNLKMYLRIVQALAFGAFTSAFIAFYFPDPDGERLAYWRGNFNDPNELGMNLLLGLPIAGLLFATGRGLFVRLFWLVACGPMLWALLRTSSRGAFLALGAMLLVAWLAASPIRKFALLFGSAAVFLILLNVLPTYLRVRLFSIFSVVSTSGEDLNQKEMRLLQGAAIGSTEERIDLMKDAFWATLRSPLFGVGLGNFGTERWEYYRAQNINKGAQTAHNTYLQISSEMGIPALILFLTSFYVAFRDLLWVRAMARAGRLRDHLRFESAASFMILALIAFLAAAMTLSLAQMVYMWLVLGFAAALRSLADLSVVAPLAPARVPGVPLPGPAAYPTLPPRTY